MRACRGSPASGPGSARTSVSRRARRRSLRADRSRSGWEPGCPPRSASRRRTVSVGVAAFPADGATLDELVAAASSEIRSRWELLGDGEGIHWPETDEDPSVAGLLAGVRVPAA